MDFYVQMRLRAARAARCGHTLLLNGGVPVSIWIRKKQAREKADREAKIHSQRKRKPALPALELPEDVAGDSARIILMGSGRALVENLLGIADVGRECIRLTIRDGIIAFRGEGLCLTDVRAGAAAVTGQIESVELPHRLREEAGHD